MSLYLDSSAIVKLVQREAQSAALGRYLRQHRDQERVSSALARVEVIRAVGGGGPQAVAAARRALDRLFLVPLDRGLLDEAAVLGGAVLRSLDAIHLASARRLGDELGGVVTYDIRMRDAAEALDLAAVAPC